MPTGPGPEPVPQPRRRSKLSVLLGVSGGTIVLDQLSKSFIRVWLQPGDRVPVLGEALTMTYLLNPGGALGWAWGGVGRVVFLGASASALLGLIFFFMPRDNRPRLYAVALMLGGALGNLIDRFREPPGVVDFIHLRVSTWSFPVFNLADVAVMTGCMVLIGVIWWDERALRARTG